MDFTRSKSQTLEAPQIGTVGSTRRDWIRNQDIQRQLGEINIIKGLNEIISENKPYNLRLCTFTFQEKNLCKVNIDEICNFKN